MAYETLIRETPADALKLKVRAAEGYPYQFWIENDHMRLENHDREYVSFSGFYGRHGPEMFAAAPEMAKLLRKLRFAHLPGEWDAAVAEVDALLSRIEGG